jgi:16S rRNA (adenine1518-N6/adenine1519-N6)-dimethyltransferase
MNAPARRRPRKSLGQHWLSDPAYLKRIAGAADFGAADTVVEIGAGTGLLTARLAERASRLIAVEVDAGPVARLRKQFGDAPKVSIVEADVLEATPEEILERGDGGLPYVVVGNLPYFIGTAIVRRFLEARAKPRWMVVMLQSEVAEAMCAQPGEMTFLSAQVQMYAECRVLFQVPPKAFRPPPKVRSAVVRLDVREGPAVEVDDTQAFLRLVAAGMAAPRKQLRNSLAVGLEAGKSKERGATSKESEVGAVLELAGVDGSRRPAELSLEEWREVYRAWVREMGRAKGEMGAK